MLFNREKTGKGHLAWGDFLWHSIDGIYSVYIADVTVSDVSFLWAGLANGIFGRNIKENERMLSIYLERLDFVIEQERKEQREKQRVAGAVSVIGGMMLVILFI